MQTQRQITRKPVAIRKSAHASPQTHLLQFIFGAALISFLLFAYHAISWRNAYNFRAALDTCAKPFCDFATFYYPMGETIFQAGLPLKGFVYSPFIAILLAVFQSLGLDASLLLWGILQAIFVLLYLLTFRQLVPARLPIQLLFVALVLSSIPLLHNLTWGQVGIFTTVSILGMLVFLERDRHTFAAALFAFAASFKFFPTIFLLPFILRRDFRFLLFAVIACGIFLIAVPCLLLGIDNTVKFYSALLDSYRHFDWVITNYNSQHFPHVFLRLLEGMGSTAPADLPLLRGISYGIALFNMGFIFGIQHARLSHANLWSCHLVFLSIPFFLKTSWPLDLVYLPFAQALLAWRILEGENALSWKHFLPIRMAEASFLLTSIVFSSIFFFNFIGDRFAYGSAGFIFWANLLLLLVSYMELLPSVLRQIRRTPHRHRLRDRQDGTRTSFGVSVLRKWQSTFWSRSASPNDYKNDSDEVDRLVMVAGRLPRPALCSLWLPGGLGGSNSIPKFAAVVDRNPLRISLSGHGHGLPVAAWTSHRPLGIANVVLFAILTVLNITSH